MKTLLSFAFGIILTILLIGIFYLFQNKPLHLTDLQMHRPASLCVSGEATITAPTDQAHINISVESVAETAQAAAEQNNKKINNIYSALEKLGLTKTELQTSQYNIQPNYTPYPKDPKPDWSPKIISYTFTGSVNITTTRLNLIGKIIQESINNGANKIGDISFNLKDPCKYKTEAIQEATQKAMHKAQVLAKMANVKIIRTLSITAEPKFLPPPLRSNYNTMLAVANDMATVPRIESGNVLVSAVVEIKYQIKDENEK